jgi:hypothetical protein
MPIINPGSPPKDGIGLLEDQLLVAVTDLQPSQSHLFIASLDRSLIYRVSTNKKIRLRLYQSVESRDADLTRPITQPPVKGQGLILELVSTESLQNFYLSPTVWAIAANNQELAGVVTSLESQVSTVSTTIHFLR